MLLSHVLENQQMAALEKGLGRMAALLEEERLAVAEAEEAARHAPPEAEESDYDRERREAAAAYLRVREELSAPGEELEAAERDMDASRVAEGRTFLERRTRVVLAGRANYGDALLSQDAVAADLRRALRAAPEADGAAEIAAALDAQHALAFALTRALDRDADDDDAAWRDLRARADELEPAVLADCPRGAEELARLRALADGVLEAKAALRAALAAGGAAALAEAHDAATRPLLTPDVVTLVLRHYVKAPLDLGEALGGAGPGSTRDGNAPAPRRLARCLGVWAACVDAGAAALDAPALAALGKVCAGVVAPDAAVHDCRGCRAAARDLARAALLAAADFDGFGDLLAPALVEDAAPLSAGDAAARYVIALNALPCPADGRFVAAHVAAATGALVGLGALDDAGVPPPARVAAALHKCETSKTAESPCLGAHETFYAALACCASLFSQLAPTLAPPDRALIEDAAQALKRKLRNEMDPMAARNIELLDALLTDLKLDTTKKVSKQTTLDFAAK